MSAFEVGIFQFDPHNENICKQFQGVPTLLWGGAGGGVHLHVSILPAHVSPIIVRGFYRYHIIDIIAQHYSGYTKPI